MEANLKQDMYKSHFEEYDPDREQWVGPLASYKWRHDPRYIVFMLARYKISSKLLRGKTNVLDIGCGDAFGFPILLQEIPHVHGVDVEEAIIADNKRRGVLPTSVTFEVHNMITDGPLNQQYESALSFDVLSSISRANEEKFMINVCGSLNDDAMYIMGAQNLNSTKYSYSKSHEDQENFKNYDEMNEFMSKYFRNVLIFGMNDETLHTGREVMTQYFLAVGITPRR